MPFEGGLTFFLRMEHVLEQAPGATRSQRENTSSPPAGTGYHCTLQAIYPIPAV